MYEDQQPVPREPVPQGPEIISTSQAVNLTCTLAALSALTALFLCFADQRSRAIRRYAIQSVGLGILHIALGILCWIVGIIFSWVPAVGGLLSGLVTAVFILASLFVIILRIRMMFRAYRGEGYALPGIGQALRRFE